MLSTASAPEPDFAPTPAPAPAERPREWFHAADLDSFAAQLARGRQIERGCVTVISLDAIRERLGSRWAKRREQVWDAVDRLLERRLPPASLYRRIGDVDYLVEAGATPEQAQANSFKILRELHLFFLGEPRSSEMRVSQVLSMADGEVSSRRLEPRSFAPDAPPMASAWSTLSFVPASYRMHVAFERQPVILLSSGRVTGTRVRPQIVLDEEALANPGLSDGLSHAERLAIDRATMLEAQNVGDGAVIAPFFFETLSSTRGRAAVLDSLGGRGLPRGLVIELVGVEAGTPHSRLMETVGLLAPYCAGQIARATPGRPSSAFSAGARLSGLSVDCEDGVRGLDPATRISDARGTPGVGPLVFAFGLPSQDLLPLARTSGATHATLALHPPVN